MGVCPRSQVESGFELRPGCPQNLYRKPRRWSHKTLEGSGFGEAVEGRG